MPLGQEVMLDYSTTGLSLKEHPVALVRGALSGERVVTAKAAVGRRNGSRVKVAGLVLIRQRPGTASGIVFITLEDETGIVNLIVRPAVWEKYRPVARHAGLLLAHGLVETHSNVTHVLVSRLEDRSGLLAGYKLASRDFH
jgi:error-prone DNA polymerase